MIPTQFDSGAPQRHHDRDRDPLPDGLEREVDLDDGHHRIPESWARAGDARLRTAAGDALWLAVRVRTGTESTVRVADGECVDATPVLEVLYVRADAQRALSKTYEAVRVESGRIPDPGRYAARIAEIRGAGWELEERARETVVDDVLDLYGHAALRRDQS